jgi:hypothetical protein
MLFLSRPSDQDRLNATVFELIHLKVGGSVCVPGCNWDCSNTLDYLEKRLKKPFIGTSVLDGSVFNVLNKSVAFTEYGVFIESLEEVCVHGNG